MKTTIFEISDWLMYEMKVNFGHVTTNRVIKGQDVIDILNNTLFKISDIGVANCRAINKVEPQSTEIRTYYFNLRKPLMDCAQKLLNMGQASKNILFDINMDMSPNEIVCDFEKQLE